MPPFWYPGIQYAERGPAGDVDAYWRQYMNYAAMGPMVGVPMANPIDDPWVFALDQNPTAKKKLKYSRAARQFISKQISKYVRPPYNMELHQAIAVAHEGARKKGYKIPPRPKARRNPDLSSKEDRKRLEQHCRFWADSLRENMTAGNFVQAARADAGLASLAMVLQNAYQDTWGRKPWHDRYTRWLTGEQAKISRTRDVYHKNVRWHQGHPVVRAGRRWVVHPYGKSFSSLTKANTWLDAHVKEGAPNPYLSVSPYPIWNFPEGEGYRAPLPVRPQIPNYHGLPPADVPPPNEPNPTSKRLKKGVRIRLKNPHRQRKVSEIGRITGPGSDRGGKRKGSWNIRWEDDYRRSLAVPSYKLQAVAEENPEDGGYLMVINPKKNPASKAAASFKKLTGRKPTAKELKTYQKAYDQYIAFHQKEPGALIPVQVQPGSSKFVVGVGQATEMNYKVPWPSARAKTGWTHKAGDHGRKKKTRPAYFAGDPSTGMVLLAQPKGSKVYFHPRKGLMG